MDEDIETASTLGVAKFSEALKLAEEAFASAQIDGGKIITVVDFLEELIPHKD